MAEGFTDKSAANALLQLGKRQSLVKELDAQIRQSEEELSRLQESLDESVGSQSEDLWRVQESLNGSVIRTQTG